jgi:hypothetical protein
LKQRTAYNRKHRPDPTNPFARFPAVLLPNLVLAFHC